MPENTGGGRRRVAAGTRRGGAGDQAGERRARRASLDRVPVKFFPWWNFQSFTLCHFFPFFSHWSNFHDISVQ